MQDFIIVNNKANLWYGLFPRLSEHGVRHACSTRLSGQSAIFDSTDFNLSFNVGDNAEFVMQNRHKLADAIGVDATRLVVTRQVHKNNIVIADENYIGRGHDCIATALAETDGIITNKPNVPLLLFFADCVPVILFDPIKRAIGLVHAGWRGTVSRIAAKAISMMNQEYGSNPADCLAFVGPSAGPCCYEVDTTVAKAIQQEFDFANRVLTPTSPGHWHLDLWMTNKLQLVQAGLSQDNILISNACTICNKKLFFSHRSENGFTGRLGVIVCL